MAASSTEAGVEALNLLKSTDPPMWLAPDSSLSHAARTASQHIFSSLRPYAPKSPFDHLLVHGFDAEQIWQQIDIQSQPILSTIRRDLKRFEKNPEEISDLKLALEGEKKSLEDKYESLDDENDGFEENMEELDEEDEEEEEEEDEKEDAQDEGEEDDENSNEKRIDREGGDTIEDGFLKIKELEEFLEEDEAREYGLESNNSKEKEKQKQKQKQKKKEKGSKLKKNKEMGENDSETDDEDEDDDEFGHFGIGDNEDDDFDGMGNARYKDFFGAKKKVPVGKQSKLTDKSEDSDMDDEEDDGDGDLATGDEEEDDGKIATQKQENLSTHEKQLKKLQSEIQQMENANLEPKTWTMQGEVSAAKRPMNSALEVDLDFEHNVRPVPVITEEVTASLEEMIRNRIIEGHFDDVQKAPRLPHEAPKLVKELDENKSKKGLGEIYEEEFVQKTNLNSAPLSVSDGMKQEASMLFKKLSVKLDALSHFYFTPKPVIEDMYVPANIPALAMEEIAPIAVSDAAMLAPEEVFSGKGDFKEEAELDRSERKKRRANKKRRHRAMVAKRDAKRQQLTAIKKKPVDDKEAR